MWGNFRSVRIRLWYRQESSAERRIYVKYGKEYFTSGREKREAWKCVVSPVLSDSSYDKFWWKLSDCDNEIDEIKASHLLSPL